MNFIIFDFVGFDTRFTSRQRHTANNWGRGWNIGWNPSTHENPFEFQFPYSTNSVAQIFPLSARFIFEKWENVKISDVEAWEITGKYDYKTMLLLGKI